MTVDNEILAVYETARQKLRKLFESRKKVIQTLASELERLGRRVDHIASEIIAGLRDCDVSKSLVYEALDKKYKVEYRRENALKRKTVLVPVSGAKQEVESVEPEQAEVKFEDEPEQIEPEDQPISTQVQGEVKPISERGIDDVSCQECKIKVQSIEQLTNERNILKLQIQELQSKVDKLQRQNDDLEKELTKLQKLPSSPIKQSPLQLPKPQSDIQTQKTIELKIYECYTNDAGRGVARIDYDYMKSLNASAGDVVEIRSKDGRTTVARCLPLTPTDSGKGIIRIDGLIRQNAGVRIPEKRGIQYRDTVKVRKIKAIRAEKVIVAPLDSAALQVHERCLADALQSLALIKGDNVMVPYDGGRISFKVIDVTPAVDAVLVRQKTIFQISNSQESYLNHSFISKEEWEKQKKPFNAEELK